MIGAQDKTDERAGITEVASILIADRIAREGIDLLRSQLPDARIDERPGLSPDQLKAIIGDYSALVVRSETQVTADVLAAGPVDAFELVLKPKRLVATLRR